MPAEGKGNEPLPAPTEQESEPGHCTEHDIAQLLAKPPADSGPSTTYQPGFPTLDFSAIEGPQALTDSQIDIQIRRLLRTNNTNKTSTLIPRMVMLFSVPQSKKKDKLLKTAQDNGWYEWAMYTAEKSRTNNCWLCMPSPLKRLIVIPNQYDCR